MVVQVLSSPHLKIKTHHDNDEESTNIQQIHLTLMRTYVDDSGNLVASPLSYGYGVREAVGLFAGGSGDITATHVVEHRGSEPLEWKVDNLGHKIRMVTCVRVYGSSVIYVGSVHPSRVERGVLSKQTLHRFNTHTAMAPTIAEYVPRTFYVKPHLETIEDPGRLAENRVSMLLELAQLITGLTTMEERVVAAVNWHEKAFEGMDDKVDDASQIVVSHLIPHFDTRVGNDLREAEGWIRMVRTLLTAPSEHEILSGISWPMTRKRRLRRKGGEFQDKRTHAPKNTVTGKFSRFRTIIPCRGKNNTIEGLPWDFEAMQKLEGWQATRLPFVPKQTFTVEVVVPFESVPELLPTPFVEFQGDLSVVIRPCDLWAVEVSRRATFRRDECLTLVQWAKGKRRPVKGPSKALNLPPMDAIYDVAPRCIQSLVDKMKQERLDHSERRALIPWLIKAGYDPEVVDTWMQQNWTSSWNGTGAEKDMKDFAADALKDKVYAAGCKEMRRIKHCPFSSSETDIEELYKTLCFRHGRETHGFDSPKEVIYHPLGYLRLVLYK